jgi:hypothetical protein
MMHLDFGKICLLCAAIYVVLKILHQPKPITYVCIKLLQGIVGGLSVMFILCIPFMVVWGLGLAPIGIWAYIAVVAVICFVIVFISNFLTCVVTGKAP